MALGLGLAVVLAALLALVERARCAGCRRVAAAEQRVIAAERAAAEALQGRCAAHDLLGDEPPADLAEVLRLVEAAGQATDAVRGQLDEVAAHLDVIDDAAATAAGYARQYQRERPRRRRLGLVPGGD